MYVLEAGTAPDPARSGEHVLGLPHQVRGHRAVLGAYDTRIRAVNACGAERAVPTRGPFTLACTPPPAPAAFASTRPGVDIALTWSASTGAAVYVLQAELRSGRQQSLPRTDSARRRASRFPPLFLPAGVYDLRVAALGPCGLSAASEELAITPPVLVGAAPSPGGPRATSSP